MASTTTTGDCIVCGEKTAMRCQDCSDRLDSNGQPSPTYYCSEQCRVGHRSQHKGHCKDNVNIRTQLERGAGLLQVLSRAFRLAGFDFKFQSVEKKGDKLIAHEASDEMGGNMIIFPFPDDMVSNDRDKFALIALYSCGDGPGYLCELTKEIFKGIRSMKLTEQQLRVNKKFWRVEYYRGGELDTTNFRHEIIVATLSNGSKYAFDLAGAQYGQLKALVPYEEYRTKYVVETFPEKAFGFRATYLERALKGEESVPVDADMRVAHMQMELMKCMNAAVKEWEKSNKQTVAQLLKEKLPVFVSKKEALVTKVQCDMQDFVMRWEGVGEDLEETEVATNMSAKSDATAKSETATKGNSKKSKKQNGYVSKNPRVAALEKDFGGRDVDDVPVQRTQLSASDIDKQFANTNMHPSVKDMLRKFAAGGGHVVIF